MKALEEIYGEKFFRIRDKLMWRADIICEGIINILDPKSVIDVGCAIGDLIKGFDKLGRVCYGIEGAKTVIPYLVVDKEKVYIEDLRLPLSIKDFFDLVLCIEVAEHIEPEHSNQFVDNLINLSDRILMTAATPGQGGHYHVNCKPFEYWINKFAHKGFIYVPSIVEQIQGIWKPWKNKYGFKANYHNLLYFTRRPHASRCNNHGGETPRSIVRNPVLV
jgi:hypothetical protein